MTVSVSSIRHTPTTLFTSSNAGISGRTIREVLGHTSWRVQELFPDLR